MYNLLLARKTCPWHGQDRLLYFLFPFFGGWGEGFTIFNTCTLIDKASNKNVRQKEH